MSVEKKRDRGMQRLVRERQAKTGESYQAAWRQLVEQEATNFAPVTNQAQTQEAMPSSADTASGNIGRIALPFSTAVIVLPGHSVLITARAQIVSFWPDRLLIKNADRWDVHRLTIGTGKSPWSSLIEDEHRQRCATVFSLDTWEPLMRREVALGEPLIIEVSYSGPNKQGECFEAALFGWDGCPPAPRTTRKETDNSKRVSERAKSKSVHANEMVILPMTVASASLFVDRFTITDAEDWIVHDIRTHGRSIFMQNGDLPGDLFTGSAPVLLAPLAAKDLVEIAATYIGNNTTTALAVELSGTTEAPSTQRAASYFLPLSTDVSIAPTQSAQLKAAPGKYFLPERLVIADPDAWIINDIKVGHRCQTAQSGGLPGQCFSIKAVGCDMAFDPVPMGVNFEIDMTREEDCKEDAGFYSGVQGRLVEQS